MIRSFILGLDYGSESARGVLIDADTGKQVGSHRHDYRHGIMTRSLPDGTPLARAWALQNAADYTEAAEEILGALGREKNVISIGVGFTASSPMPASEVGIALSQIHPGDPHAYVKLWKHGAAQSYADIINSKGGCFLDNFGGKLSGEWLLAKAAQIADEAPATWEQTGRFIEAGDWLVWQLTGNEARSLSFAAYKAQYSDVKGYPRDIVPDLSRKLSAPLRIGSSAGQLTEEWRKRTGIEGTAIVAVAVIDSHVVLPAIDAVSSGCLVGALGTSAAYLYLNESFRPLPPGIEGVAKDGSVRDLWCYEAGQASFGDTLAWFVKTFPRGDTPAGSFGLYNREAAKMEAGANHLVALDWWNGNRVPRADSGLSGLLVGLTTETTGVGIYRALVESLCYGAKTVVDLFEAQNFPINRILMTSGLAQNNPFLVQVMADVMGRTIEVPEIANATAVGAAIHGAVAAGLVLNYPDGATRFGARTFKPYSPRLENAAIYRLLYSRYRELCDNVAVQDAMHGLNKVAERPSPAA